MASGEDSVAKGEHSVASVKIAIISEIYLRVGGEALDIQSTRLRVDIGGSNWAGAVGRIKNWRLDPF